MKATKGGLSHSTNTLCLADTFRGLPSGYVNALEQRLCDTEAALHDAITDLHRLKEDSSPYLSSHPLRLNLARSSKTAKTSMLAEWGKYPLQSPEDVERWWVGLGEEDEDSAIAGKSLVPKRVRTKFKLTSLRGGSQFQPSVKTSITWENQSGPPDDDSRSI